MLNEYQKRAVTHAHGPLMVIAGPGSGKTFTVTEKIAYSIRELGVSPGHILVVTFSRAAAKEMRERFLAKMNEMQEPGKTSEQVTFGTFHSVFYSILKRAYGEAVSRYITAEDPVTGSRDAVRYDEMLRLAYELLSEREDIRKLVRQRYTHILIDEFQDIDALQYAIVRLITGPDPDLTVVGDDDQSIYGFRGAEPGIMLDFVKDYPSVTQVPLHINYRSVSQIVHAAGKLIGNNRNRFQKDLSSARGEGKPVRLIPCTDVREEYDLVASEIRKYEKDGGSFGDIAVLFRTRTQPWGLSYVLEDHGIAYEEPEIRKLYDGKKDEAGEVPRVRLMTFHASKGLQFKRVYIIDVNQGICPHAKAQGEEGIEEERRLFYVAMTRAADELAILWCRRRHGRKAEPSIFIKELCN